MIVVAAGLWIGWTIWQMRGENAEYARIADVVRETKEQGGSGKGSSPGR